jgi:hypothetical protein
VALPPAIFPLFILIAKQVLENLHYNTATSVSSRYSYKEEPKWV